MGYNLVNIISCGVKITYVLAVLASVAQCNSGLSKKIFYEKFFQINDFFMLQRYLTFHICYEENLRDCFLNLLRPIKCVHELLIERERELHRKINTL